MRVDDLVRRADEGWQAGEDLEGDAADRVQVRARVDAVTHDALRRHVLRGTPDRVVSRRHRAALSGITADDLRHAEVEDLERVVRQHDEVARLDVAMDDAARMRVMHGVRELGQQVHTTRERDRLVAAQHLRHRLALGVFHREVEATVGELPEVVDRDDVGMAQPVDRTRLAAKPRHELRIVGERPGQDLQRLVPLQREVFDEVNLAHPPTPQLAEDPPAIVKHGADHRGYNGRMRAIAAGVAVTAMLAACPGPKVTVNQCVDPSGTGSGWTCVDSECGREPAFCGDEAVVACRDTPDFQACGSGSACYLGICTACSAELEGCSFQGWEQMQSGTSEDLNAIWVGNDLAYAVGNDNTVLSYDGGAWRPDTGFLELAPSLNLTQVWGSSASDVYVLTSSLVLEHYDGTAWTKLLPPSGTARAMWGTGPGKVIVADANVPTPGVWELSAGMWTQLSPGPSSVNYHAVWADGPDDVFVVAALSAASWEVLRYDGSAWTTVALPSPCSTNPLSSIWGTGSNDVYVAGRLGSLAQPTLCHYDGSSWTWVFQTPSPNVGQISLATVWGRGSDVFAAGSAAVLEYSGGAWTTSSTAPLVTCPGAGEGCTGGVSGSGSADVFAVGAAGAIWHYVGQ